MEIIERVDMSKKQMSAAIFTLCDHASVVQGTGKFNVMGAFTEWASEEAPAIAAPFFVALQIKYDPEIHVPGGKYFVKIRFLDGTDQLAEVGVDVTQSDIVPPDDMDLVLNVSVQLNGIILNRFGVYDLVVLRDDLEFGRTQFALRQGTKK